ncbi:MAG TPA: ATP-grasp domain-containing protein [Candidatus Aminicenantes bacterium]|nr:ATP-grasp domain-containing protein [Candidatus Aminicenantes bacterium]
MNPDQPEYDRMYLKVEQMCRDFALFPPSEHRALHRRVRGLLSPSVIETRLKELEKLDLNDYIARTVQPAGEPSRPGSMAVIHRLGGTILRKVLMGPLAIVEMEMDFSARRRRIGIIAQERTIANGVWMPEHHEAAAWHAREFANLGIPIITFIDTPGADAGEIANRGNQAHQISRLIAEMVNIDVPTVAVILGNGYSGGAIPLAAANLLLSVRDGVFNTIHPSGLASIARKLNLSWQECARFVGVSAMELFSQAIIDGIIDFVPGEDQTKLENLRSALTTAIKCIETENLDFVSRTPEIHSHYRRSVYRFIDPSLRLRFLKEHGVFHTAPGPTEHLNVFGAACRYQRYLNLRSRVRSTTKEQYGRLALAPSPPGVDMNLRLQRQQQAIFQAWLQDPDRVAYDDRMLRALKSFHYWFDNVHRQRGRLHTLLLGDAHSNLEWSRDHLQLLLGFFVLNRWKTDAPANFRFLLDALKSPQRTCRLFTKDALADPAGLAAIILSGTDPVAKAIKQRISFEARQVFSLTIDDPGAGEQLRRTLTAELNRILADPDLDAPPMAGDKDSQKFPHERNRRLLEEAFPTLLRPAPDRPGTYSPAEATVLDVMLDPGLRPGFIREIRDLLVFDLVYDQFVVQLPRMAKAAHRTWSLPQNTVAELLENAIAQAGAGLKTSDPDLFAAMEETGGVRARILAWLRRLSAYPRRHQLLAPLEEWKSGAYPRISETLFVVITDIFCRLLPQYFRAETHPDAYIGRINPARIGRKKDFWNRLSVAYQDLLIHEVLAELKQQGRIPACQVIDRFFTDFQEMDANVMTADPRRFPGFRASIEKALNSGITPCGAVTGLARFSRPDLDCRVGVLVSNPEFQAGAFDMAATEKLCRLLTHCARRRLPLIGFVSSGGMQTKEGAGGLFPMAVVNALITRFVRDHDLPVIMFGFGDCTGGAQASFVTHPLVHSWYFSGTNMPFAGQIVVPAHLPARSTLSNYLSTVPGFMSGLVAHAFAPQLDDRLREIDPDIPIPHTSVEEVMSLILRDTHPHAQSGATDPPAPLRPVYRPIQRVLLHARGCTAARLIEQAHRRDHQVVLIQSDPDMDSLPAAMLKESDRLVCIGGNTPGESYLNALSVLRVARMEEADALHPGIGFLSENADFARLCLKHGLNFIGPPVESMEAMGNKSNAIQTAQRHGVPVVPGSHGILADSAHAARVAAETGYPVLLKAVHGGGGKGIRVVRDADAIHQAFMQISTEAHNAFGNGDIYLEKFITRLRHIEVQVLRDCHGNLVIPGIRDCSVQRNNQKLVEESASTLLPVELERSVRDAAARLCDAINYVGAGTVEFILDLDGPAVYFMEMNTRLQVEHPVTEVVSGIDIVDAQFRIAEGKRLKNVRVKNEGHALEVRINAEKPVMDAKGRMSFVSTPGTITSCRLPEQRGIRIITIAAEGRTISPYYDSLIIQAIAHGRNREQAVNRMLKWLAGVDIQGIPTNIPLLRRILADADFRKGDFSTNFLEQFTRRLDTVELIRETETAAGVAAGGDVSLRIPDSLNLKVLSPSTGVFYLTPSPNEPEFVQVGDVVDVNHPLCLLEAMKQFTQVTLAGFNTETSTRYSPDTRFRVERINMTSGQPVNAGDLLFIIRPMTE